MSFCSRFWVRKLDVGLGPQPLINNIYHKKALNKFGYKAETFVSHVYSITSDFDIIIEDNSIFLKKLLPYYVSYYLFIRAIFTYKILYLYFHGGPLWNCAVSKYLEPYLYKLAQIKTVLMPYGSDIHDVAKSHNLIFKHVMSRQYPNFTKLRKIPYSNVERWSKHADFIISGCEWVDFMHYWDLLTLAHFSIDTEDWKPFKKRPISENDCFKILHAPNHRHIKGTQFFIDAVQDLQAEGLNIELVLLEKVDNRKIRETMELVDIVADQLNMGWYALFAIEGMSMEKPVLCYLRDDLLNLYQFAGLIKPDEIPIINCNTLNIKEIIRDLYNNRQSIIDIGKRSREYVIKHHSLEAIGSIFHNINISLGIKK